MDRLSSITQKAHFEPVRRPSRRGSASTSPANLLDPRFEHDSCGVGFVAATDGKPAHSILAHALTALARLAHRGAVAADGASSDGVGIMTAIPRELLLAAAGLELPAETRLGVGMLFLPEGDGGAEALIERCLAEQRLLTLGWRDVPIRTEVLGEIARSTMPRIRQILVRDEEGMSPEALERRLYLARKSFERHVEAGETEAYLCSLSAEVIVYKAMCLGRLLPEFYTDLQSPVYRTRFAIFHQRYATNTLPAWHRAQPGRKLAHNGEINTVWGNRARMDARDSTLPAECKPILTADGTDSTSLDEAVELISQNGRTLAESVRMLLPPAAVDRVSPFLRYHIDCAEPWDGPAAIAFSDGRIVGAALDRNGLRPSRYAITVDGLVVAGSEAGLVDLDPNEVIESGRLGPGQMLVVDLDAGRVLHNDELLDLFDAQATYATLLEDSPLEGLTAPAPTSDLLPLQRGFGYTKEDLKIILQPMATTGKDAVWSMGDDAPLAFLARSPRPLYHYFRQRFAQVTNPAIDPLREAVVVSLHTRLGPWPHLLDTHAPLPGISLPSPFLSLGHMAALRAGQYPHADSLPFQEISCLFSPSQSLEQAVAALCETAKAIVRAGAGLILLTDRHATAGALPIPMAMATGAVNEALTTAGLRTQCGLAVEAGDCRDIHHAAVLIGYGAGAVCPWLALETARTMQPEGVDGEAMMRKALEAGLAKVMSKMGISVVDSYRSAHLFDILGLHASVVEQCFHGTPAPLSGIGFPELDRRLRASWGAAPAAEPSADLPDFGWVRFRKSEVSEPHQWQPPTVKALQTVVGSARNVAAGVDPAAQFAIFSRDVDMHDASRLRDLLEIRPAGPELDLAAVENPQTLCHRFVASAMSLGSLSPEAHQTVTAAMNMLGARSNTGEGGEDPSVYRPASVDGFRTPGGGGGELSQAAASAAGGAAVAELVAAPAVHVARVSLNNKIKQVASGRFGVTAEYLAHAEEIEIKVAQGAKPGEGGQLPGHKVSGLIARLRHAQPGVSLISPPPHHDIYSIEDLAQLIYDLKRVNPRAAVGVKLVSSFGVGTVAAGVAKAYADYVVIAGNSGGTGAAALSSIKYAGSPWELGLAEAQQALRANGMRERVRLRADGGLTTARDVLIAALLGADEFAFGTAVLVAIGCDMARQCHLNTCPVGIATQRPELRARFRGKPEHIVTLFEQLSTDLARLLAKFGLPSIEAAIGRVDLLEQVRTGDGLDLSPMLANVDQGARHWMGLRNDRPGEDERLDEDWTAPAMTAARRGESFSVRSTISNAHRAVGAHLAGELAVARAKGELEDVDITFELDGVAGQSFGAFANKGMHLVLSGQANDFVGKGLSGADLVLRATGRAAQNSQEHVLLGNVALYGATSGRLFAAGRAGERFAVRNSGASAVVEGVGDHGCEYMTGGTVVILGPIGMNFGAGMTGGTAWIYDEDGDVLQQERFHTEFLEAAPYQNCTAEQQAALHTLLEEHVRLAHSHRASQLSAGWQECSPRFVLFTPKPQA
ncbi:MAG: glutamate synthase-related protein [Janthinobacterium lividum]